MRFLVLVDQGNSSCAGLHVFFIMHKKGHINAQRIAQNAAFMNT